MAILIWSRDILLRLYNRIVIRLTTVLASEHSHLSIPMAELLLNE